VRRREFKDLDLDRVFESMCKPSFVFDGRNILDHDRLMALGFRVVAIGKPRTWGWRQEVY
jgi:UDPglucose 6-dehydrogenase